MKKRTPYADGEHYTASAGLVLAAFDNSVVGWTATEKRILLGEGVISEITGLVVRSGCRRTGIGQLLINAVETWSQNLGLSRILVRSNVLRVEPHEFYPSVGFKLVKTTKVYAKQLNGPDKPRKKTRETR